MYTYLQCFTPYLNVRIDGEISTIDIHEPIKGIIELTTNDNGVTIHQLNIALMGVREKSRALKLDRFNVNHSVDIDGNNLLKYPFRMMINPDKWDSSMTIEFDMKIKTNVGEIEASSSFVDVVKENDEI